MGRGVKKGRSALERQLGFTNCFEVKYYLLKTLNTPNWRSTLPPSFSHSSIPVL